MRPSQRRSVPERTVRDWLSRIDKDSKAARDKRIFDLWMQCWTQEEIAAAVGCSRQTVDAILPEMARLPKLAKSDKAAASHAATVTGRRSTCHALKTSIAEAMVHTMAVRQPSASAAAMNAF